MTTDAPKIVHCESFLILVESSYRTSCEVEEFRLAEQDPLIWKARSFIFGIRHPDLQGRLCPLCIAHIRKLVGVPS